MKINPLFQVKRIIRKKIYIYFHENPTLDDAQSPEGLINSIHMKKKLDFYFPLTS